MTSRTLDSPLPLDRTTRPPQGDPRAPAVDIVVPVHNEEADLEESVRRLHRYLTDGFPFTCRVTIADNASNDATGEIARALASELPGVRTVHLGEKGRGRALRHAWSASEATVLAYMDVDLSTDLAALLPLVAPLLSGHSDVAIGSRLSRTARVLRGLEREILSRGYNVILHAVLGTRFSDAQCGFKALRGDVAHALLPLVQDEEWFFDTELLVLAERAGLRIHEVPVDWTDDLDSRVEIVPTAVSDLKGVARLARALATGTSALDHVRARFGRHDAALAHRTGGQVLRFAAVGVVSTLAYLLGYLTLRIGLDAQQANAVALVVTAIGNTAANRRFTFSVRGRTGAVRHQLQGLVVFALALGVTSSSLGVLHAADPRAGRTTEVAVLVAANVIATVMRFLLLRAWVFRGRPDIRADTHAAPRTLLRGRAEDPAWVRPSLLALLGGTALLYVWGLGASGWANSFYSAAVQAGTQSWKAFFFGSLDAASSITVDKPPAALWVMEISARLFGVNSWSILVPEALMGVAAVGLLYATVRRRFGPQAGLLAATVLALTPVATLMFRFDNPDALLTLLLVAAAYALTRALEAAGTGWLVATATLVGTGFLTKMLQAFLVVPVFALVYLCTANASLRRRITQLLAAGAALVVASGWWVAVVELTPASARPYVGGSQTNSVLNLVFGYNGFGRITGNETGSVGGGPAGTAGRWGATGLTRLFGSEFGGQIAWLIPAALVLLAALVWLSRRATRTDQQRAQVLMWGGWLLVTGLTFSYARGIIHPYYAVALAPAVAALVGIGAVVLWRHRRAVAPRVTLAGTVAVTTWWAWLLLDRSPGWHPALRVAIVLVGVSSAAALLAASSLSRRAAALVATSAVITGLAGPAAYAVDTAATPHTGAIPSAGPALTGARGFGGPGAFGGGLHPRGLGPGGFPPRGGGFTPGLTPRAGRGPGGLLDATTPSGAVVQALTANASSYTWVAATVGANNAAGYQLATDEPVMAIGGFNGSDPSPTLAQFQALAHAGRIHYFIARGVGRGAGGGLGGGLGGGFGRPGGSGVAAQITAWVEQSFPSTSIGGVTVYDLTAAANGS